MAPAPTDLMDIETFESWSLFIGLTGLVSYMLFVIWQLGRESGAGRFGYFVLFGALGLGIFGFIAKGVLTYLLER